MKSNYDLLGNHIRLVDSRNSDSITDKVLGISIDKYFMPSVANVIGTDLSKYKLLSKGLFACNPMHVGRDERLPVALYTEETPAIVSPAYFMFEIADKTVLNADFLMMWFRRPEFDRECWFKTDGSVRGGITWDDICRIDRPETASTAFLKELYHMDAVSLPPESIKTRSAILSDHAASISPSLEGQSTMMKSNTVCACLRSSLQASALASSPYAS